MDALETHLIAKKAGIGRHLSRRTIDMALRTLRLVLAHAQARGIVSENAVDTWKAILSTRGRRRVSAPRHCITTDEVLDTSEREALLGAFQAHKAHYFPLVLFLAETGCRIGEALKLSWTDVDLAREEARLYRSKTGDSDWVELSERLVGVLRGLRPDLCPGDLRVFRTPHVASVAYRNFKGRVWDPVVIELFGKGRRVNPHTLRHTWATLHLSRGTPLEWIRRMGGWRSTQMLLDCYSHFLPREMTRFSNALSASRPTQTEPKARASAAATARSVATP